jgi:hypothetical protein
MTKIDPKLISGVLFEDNMDGSGWATYSPDKQCRYTLGRVITENVNLKPKRILWIMLNPSTADAFVLDPTLTRCYGFSKYWGFTEMIITNIFAFRSTDPKKLSEVFDPVGVSNDRILQAAFRDADAIVLAWGADPMVSRRKALVMEMLKRASCPIYCLGVNKDGSPKHPLYLKKNQERYEFVLKNDKWYIKGLPNKVMADLLATV